MTLNRSLLTKFALMMIVMAATAQATASNSTVGIDSALIGDVDELQQVRDEYYL